MHAVSRMKSIQCMRVHANHALPTRFLGNDGVHEPAKTDQGDEDLFQKSLLKHGG